MFRHLLAAPFEEGASYRWVVGRACVECLLSLSFRGQLLLLLWCRGLFVACRNAELFAKGTQVLCDTIHWTQKDSFATPHLKRGIGLMNSFTVGSKSNWNVCHCWREHFETAFGETIHSYIINKKNKNLTVMLIPSQNPTSDVQLTICCWSTSRLIMIQFWSVIKKTTEEYFAE